ncbi:MAG: DUF805 domain-containing protein [Chloroflexota bacterium]
MSFPDAIRTGFQKYVVFKGRASRPEFWYWILFTIVAGIVLGIIEGILHTRNLLQTLFNLAVFLPTLAVSIRRLHDTGRSGWFLLFLYVPWIVGFVFLAVGAGLGIAAAFTGVSEDARSGAVALGGAAIISALIGAVLCLAGFAFSIYIMAKRGDLAPNAYGPPPGTMLAA